MRFSSSLHCQHVWSTCTILSGLIHGKIKETYGWFLCAVFFPCCFWKFWLPCFFFFFNTILTLSLPHSLCSLPHGLATSFSRLLEHLLSACVSLDLCLFSFSNPELSRAVLLLHSRGVRVRVLTDRDYMAITGSQIGTLRKAGTYNTATLQMCRICSCEIDNHANCIRRSSYTWLNRLLIQEYHLYMNRLVM